MYYICGIPLPLVHSQLILLLKEFDRICRKHDIHYTLEGGTLLGAEKYQGFVPWDDDIDIVMLRSDYEKFKHYCKEELSDGFFLQNTDSEPKFPLTYSKLRMNDSIYLQKTYDYIDIHQGIFLDIFPLDYTQKWDLKFRRSIIGLLNGGKNVKQELIGSKKRFYQPISKYKLLMYRLVSYMPYSWINFLLQKTISAHFGNTYLYNFCNPLYNAPIYNVDRFRDYIDLRFEDGEYLAIRDYKNWLHEIFGNYMLEEPDPLTRGPSHAISSCFLAPFQKNGKLYLETDIDSFEDCIKIFVLSELLQRYCIPKEKSLCVMCDIEGIPEHLAIFMKTHLPVKSGLEKKNSVLKIPSDNIDMVVFLLEKEHGVKLGMEHNVIHDKYVLVDTCTSICEVDGIDGVLNGYSTVFIDMDKGVLKYKDMKISIDPANYFALIHNSEFVITDRIMTAVVSINEKIPFFYIENDTRKRVHTLPFKVVNNCKIDRSNLNNQWEDLQNNLKKMQSEIQGNIIEQIDKVVC